MVTNRRIHNTGIVLNSQLAKGYMITVLDKELGRMDFQMLKGAVCAGMLLEYSSIDRSGRQYIEEVNIIAVPSDLIHSDFLFLHHVLELCFYFIPPESCFIGVFDLLLRLYQQPLGCQTLSSKKFFLFKLLTTIGVYPELSNELERRAIRLHALSIDSAEHQSLDLECEQLLDYWLQRCVADHQKILQFKTVQFLTLNRLL